MQLSFCQLSPGLLAKIVVWTVNLVNVKIVNVCLKIVPVNKSDVYTGNNFFFFLLAFIFLSIQMSAYIFGFLCFYVMRVTLLSLVLV